MNKKTRWYTPLIHKVIPAAAVAAVSGRCGQKNEAGQVIPAAEPSSITLQLQNEKNTEPLKTL